MIEEIIPQVEITAGLKSSLDILSPQQIKELVYARALTDLIRTYYQRISNDSLVRILLTLNIFHQKGSEIAKSSLEKLNSDEKGILRAIYPF